MFPVILTSIQSNLALDASLATLVKVLCVTPPPQAELPAHIIISLTTFLPLLCGAHPDASTRHIAFRILARILQIAPAMLRLQVLRDLISPSEDISPHMRTAAIGLVKESVLEALSHPKTDNLFASPFLLQTIGPHIFRLDLPDLLAAIGGLDEANDNPEPARLVECLGLYYILLMRDVENKVRTISCRVFIRTQIGWILDRYQGSWDKTKRGIVVAWADTVSAQRMWEELR